MHDKGEFEPFKMLIGAIFALLVLTIIVSAIQSFEQYRILVSQEKFYTGIQNTVAQPNGDYLAIKNVFFDADTIFVASSVARRVGLQRECVYFDSTLPNPPFVLSGDDSMHITNKVETNVYASCLTNKGGGDPNCEISCLVHFGELP